MCVDVWREGARIERANCLEEGVDDVNYGRLLSSSWSSSAWISKSKACIAADRRGRPPENAMLFRPKSNAITPFRCIPSLYKYTKGGRIESDRERVAGIPRCVLFFFFPLFFFRPMIDSLSRCSFVVDFVEIFLYLS